MALINTDAIAQEINKQVLAGIPSLVDATTKAIYANTPILKAIMNGQPVTVKVDPIKLEIPPITFKLEVGGK